MPITIDEIRQRQERARKAAQERGLAALLVWSRMGTDSYWFGDAMYLTGHHCAVGDFQDDVYWNGHGYMPVVLPVDGDPVLITDLPIPDPSVVAVDDIRVTPFIPQTTLDVLKEKGLTGERIGIVGRQTFLASSRDLMEERNGGPLELVAADDILERLKAIKSPAELDAMRHAGRIGSECMNIMMDAIRAGVTEGDIVGEGLRHMVSRGGYPYDVAITSGKTSTLYHQQVGPPHWDCRRKLEVGDMIHVDLWGPVEGYFTDFARSTVVGGKPTDAQREILEAPLQAIPHLLDAIRPGAKVADLFARGEQWMKDNGWLDPSLSLADAPAEAGPLIEHCPIFGHGIGLGHERPWLVANSPFLFEEGMTIAVEFIVGRGEEAAYLEHDVIVTPDGVEILDTGCRERWW